MGHIRNRKLKEYLQLTSIMAIFLAMVLVQTPVLSQNKQAIDLLLDKAQKASVPSVPVTGPALEGPIDSDKYIVGPSDILGVNIWTVPPLSFVLTVTPEGTLIVPTVGEIRVSGLKLSQAKERVLAEIHKKYLIGNPTVTLLDPRDIVVTITGNVRFPGRYIMNAAQRVDRLIQEANKVAKKTAATTAGAEKELEENKNYQPDRASKRAIVDRHADGTSQRVDLQQFFAIRDEDRDPFLRGGDEIFVPEIDNSTNLFAVYGAVNAPGRFEYVPGDSLLQAIRLAYGVTNRANPDSIELVRINPPTGELQSTVVELKNLFPGSTANLAIQPGDRILVREKYDERRDYRVFVDGQVRFPGIYPITKNRTTLSEVIRQAGGLTEFASLQSAELLRKSVNVDDAQLDRLLRQREDITPEDNSYVNVEGDSKVRRDNVNVDFERLFAAKDSSCDVILQSDDHIIIPSVQKTVYVFGQVVTPGNVPFVAGKEAAYYIRNAGGFTDDAKEGDVAIIKWTTRQWFEPGKTKIEEGDLIWVPPVVRKPASYWLAIVGQTTSIVSVALSIVLLVIQLKKFP